MSPLNLPKIEIVVLKKVWTIGKLKANPLGSAKQHENLGATILLAEVAFLRLIYFHILHRTHRDRPVPREQRVSRRCWLLCRCWG